MPRANCAACLRNIARRGFAAVVAISPSTFCSFGASTSMIEVRVFATAFGCNDWANAMTNCTRNAAS